MLRAPKNKPEAKLVRLLNFTDVVHYVVKKFDLEPDSTASIEAVNYKHDRCLWLWLYAAEMIPCNDVYIMIDFPQLILYCGDRNFQMPSLDELQNTRAYDLMALLVKEYELKVGDDILWDISW